VFPGPDLRDRVHLFQDVSGPAEMTPARRSVRYSSSCAASSSILLVTLVCRILFDIPVAPLLIEVLAAWNLLLAIKIGIGSGTFVAALFRGYGRHFGYHLFLL